MSRRIGIVAALPGEIKPLVTGWKPAARKGLYRWVEGETELLAFAGGMGRDAAARAVGALTATGKLDGLVSAGWAGGLSCGVKPGLAYPVSEVVDAMTGERFAAETEGRPGPVRLVTSDHIAGLEEKRLLAGRYGASLVDMEAATVARLASAGGIPFYCWKAVSDVASEKLPDFNLFLGPDQQLSLPRLLAHTMWRPQYWGALLRLGRNSAAGARALRETLTKEWCSISHADAHS